MPGHTVSPVFVLCWLRSQAHALLVIAKNSIWKLEAKEVCGPRHVRGTCVVPLVPAAVSPAFDPGGPTLVLCAPRRPGRRM